MCILTNGYSYYYSKENFCMVSLQTVFTYPWSVVAERSSALDSSSGVVRTWVRIPAWPGAALVSLSKTLNHNCFVLRMGRKAVGPVCCVMHIQEPRTLIMKEKGLAPVFLDSRLADVLLKDTSATTELESNALDRSAMTLHMPWINQEIKDLINKKTLLL